MPHLICTASHPSKIQMSLSRTPQSQVPSDLAALWMSAVQVRIAWLYLLFIAGSQIFVILAITVPRWRIKGYLVWGCWTQEIFLGAHDCLVPLEPSALSGALSAFSPLSARRKTIHGRFPKIINFLGFSMKINHPAIGDPPISGNPHVDLCREICCWKHLMISDQWCPWKLWLEVANTLLGISSVKYSEYRWI